MLCLISLTLAAPAARAGSYAVSYSGGTYTDGSGNTQPDTVDGGGDYGAGPAASIQGTITVTCTWVPDDPNNPQSDPPPQNAILDETGYAYWEAEGGTTTAGGSCSDGLGDPAVPNTDSLPYLTSGSPQLDNDHYSVHAGGASFTFTCTPSVSSGGDNQDIMLYSVTVDPNPITLVGPTTDTDGNLDILIGQGCTASLTGIPGNCAISYNWTVTGHTLTFWGQEPGGYFTVEQDGYGPTSATSPHWYWSDNAGIETVSCTATVTPPAGQGSPFTITDTQEVTLVVPSYTDVETPGVSRLDSGLASAKGALSLWAGPSPTSSGYGCEWAGTVTVPAPFASTNGWPYDVSGSWDHIQLINKQVYRTPVNGGSAQAAQGDGINGLDETDPYLNVFGAYGQTASEENLLYPGVEGDSPGFGVQDAYGRYEVRGEGFEVYTMFTPSGSDVLPVPLYDFGWQWTADAVIPPGTGTASPTWSDWNTSNYNGSVVLIGTSQRTTQHPNWTALITAGW